MKSSPSLHLLPLLSSSSPSLRPDRPKTPVLPLSSPPSLSSILSVLSLTSILSSDRHDYVMKGNIEIGSLREVDVKSGLPTKTITEKLELLDDEEHSLASGLSVATKVRESWTWEEKKKEEGKEEEEEGEKKKRKKIRGKLGENLIQGAETGTDALGTANVVAAMLGLSTLCISFYSLGLWGSFYAN
ncbi:hypothetical protein Vadar_014903 [Vaccinium darrowii]|uniref:Uncharacterized protein n=1 Tax=Vaccinium darrowii TaxID=229202 RepID=A0ACB7XAD5_9ERIC|nr:hypothetical protein Vadar_014903 [Vaccinium darrowii]